MPNLNNLTTQDLQWGTANWAGTGYIEGLKMVWVSGTAVTVKTGAAYIPGLAKCLPVASDIALTSLSLSASTWYHLYLYSNSGTPAVECVTTAPVVYSGTARQKTGDASRRYLGSIKTDASGSVYNFRQDGNTISWRENTATAFRILANGQVATETSISASSAVPVTSQLATIRFTDTDASIDAYTNVSESAPGNVIVQIKASSSVYLHHPLNSSQALLYRFPATPTGGLFVDVVGYTYER